MSVSLLNGEINVVVLKEIEELKELTPIEYAWVEFADGIEIGKELEPSEISKIKDKIREKYNKKGGVIPTDCCYNLTSKNHRTFVAFNSRLHLFERLGSGQFKYLGVNYPYTGEIINRVKLSGTVSSEQVGVWNNGLCTIDGDRGYPCVYLIDQKRTLGISQEALYHPYKEKVASQQLKEDEEFYEGAVSEVSLDKYERNPEARKACIKHYGAQCAVCGFDFEKTYGEIGKDYIQVHHIIPLSEIGKEHVVDYQEDLIPVCPNCHVMLHRKYKGKYLLPSELFELVRGNSTSKKLFSGG